MDNPNITMEEYIRLQEEKALRHGQTFNWQSTDCHIWSAIVYDDALTFKLDSLTEPTISPRHIDELELKNDTSLSKHDKEEQNVVYFNDLFLFNMTYLNDLKSDKDNDDDKIDIIQSSGLNVINIDTKGSNKPLETSHDRTRLASRSTPSGFIRMVFTRNDCGGQ
ncbi:hypothetical protein Tco_0505906, partial [Tanacetum coccineum]